VDVPAAAREHSEEGAKAFARYFHETASRAFVTNDPSALEQLSAASCKGCTAIAAGVRRQAESGEHPAEPRFVFESANVQPRTGRQPYVVDVIGSDKSVEVVDRDGKVTRRVDSVPSWTRLTLTRRGDRWLVQQFAAVKAK
jgi:hypothetical protein